MFDFCSIKACSLLTSVAVFFLLLICPLQAFSETTGGVAGNEPPAEGFKRLELVFEPDAYYTNIELILALTDSPIPRIGEKSESEIYRTLLSRAAILPQFLVLEASVNPLPYFGVYLKKNETDFYDSAEMGGSFNWIQSLTAGFEEPYAISVLAGNVVAFDIAERTDMKGIGYSGYLYSAGNYHIRNNTLIKDHWQEVEWKIKGDRKSAVKKLSWSFRIGAKFHGNADITDIFYFSVRRSRLDYKIEEYSLFNNSGFEYTIDLNRDTFTPMRHFFYLDKKWPLENRKMALALALGFVWESAGKYTGLLQTGEGENFQFLFRPNIEF